MKRKFTPPLSLCNTLITSGLVATSGGPQDYEKSTFDWSSEGYGTNDE